MRYSARRRLALARLLALGLAPFATAGFAVAGALRIGTTAVFLDDNVRFLEAWRGYLEDRLRRPVRFVQRGNYGEVVDMLLRADLDAAWLCGFPFVLHQRDMALVAVPVYRGRPLYRSYLIVPAEDRATRSFADLAGKVFAFSDPLSNSGHLVPQYEISRSAGGNERLFRKSFFTWGHRKVVTAVAEGLADAGSVDGYVWETLASVHPELTARTRVVWRSPEFGFPPIVARRSLPAAERAALQAVLLDMHLDPQGGRLLRELHLDGFTAGDARLFDGIQSMLDAVPRLRASVAE